MYRFFNCNHYSDEPSLPESGTTTQVLDHPNVFLKYVQEAFYCAHGKYSIERKESQYFIKAIFIVIFFTNCSVCTLFHKEEPSF